MRHLRIVLALAALAVVVETCGGGGGPSVEFVHVSVGGTHVCALDRSGNAFCWGQNDNGELGNGTFADANKPMPVSGGLVFSQISAGNAHTCGLTTDGKIFCWGLEDYGKVGNGQFLGTQPTPALVAATFEGEPFTAVSAGADDSCALTKAQIALCWGASWLGELGNGGPVGSFGGTPTALGESRSTPVVVVGSGWTSIAAGREHTCGIKPVYYIAPSQPYCWGSNLDSEIGPSANDTCSTNGATTFPCAMSPVPVNTIFPFSAVTVGGDFTCGLVNAHAFCWGNDMVGQLGSSPNTSAPCPYQYTTIYCDPSPTPVNTPLQFSEISAGYEFACGVPVAGSGTRYSVWCWGLDDQGQLGTATGLGGQPCFSLGVTTPRCAAEALAVSTTFNTVEVSAGGSTACAVTDVDTVYCWGNNARGQLGNGTTGGTSGSPVEVTP